MFNKNKTSLIFYPGGKGESSYSIPDGVTNIVDMAFAHVVALASVTIPASVTGIEAAAFFWCDALTSVTVMGETPPSLAIADYGMASNFGDDYNDDTLYVPKGCVDAYKADAAWSAAFTNIVEQE